MNKTKKTKTKNITLQNKLYNIIIAHRKFIELLYSKTICLFKKLVSSKYY